MKNEKLERCYEDVWKNDKKMIDYCMKKTSRMIEIDGLIFTTEKPRIETRFCFGYDCSSVDNESYDNANKMVAYADTHEEYFIKENLKEIDSKIKDLQDDNIIKYYLTKGAYLGQSQENPLRNMQLDYRSSYNEMYCEEKKEEKKEATKEMIDAYIEMLQADRIDFIKRLNTYLKRYGLSKLKTWSYWND